MRLLGLVCFLSLATLQSPAQDAVYLKERGKLIHFGNDKVELTLDSGSGFFRSIRNKQTGIDHKPAGEGVWPFGLWAGTRQKPQQRTAEITADGVQKMSYKLNRQADLATLRLTYAMLLDNATHKPTGVGLGVEIALAPGRDFFVLRAEIANGGPLWVTSFYAGKGRLLTGESSRKSEHVHIPGRGGFDRSEFRGRSLGDPTYSMGWTDYSGARGGIGIGYVNRKGMQVVFDIQPVGDGLLQSWRLFDTHGYWHFERLMNEYQESLLFQPLEPANHFTTDEWLIMPHAGDWHRTADVFRERYLKAFQGDYRTWEALPEKVKNLYVQFGFFVAENSIGNTYPRKVINHLDTIVPQVRAALEAVGVEASRASVNLVFWHPNVGRYPEYFPVWEAVGGDAGMKRTLNALHKMGIGYVIGYAHLSYNHRAAKNYLVEADTLDTVPLVNPTAGHRACIDNSAWIRLWKEQLIPAYARLGFDGVYADEGHFPWGTCSVIAPGHRHGATAEGILTANTRGVMRLHKMLHEGLGAQSVIMVEGTGMVAGRWVDANHAYPDPAVAFTFPLKRYLWFLDPMTPDPELAKLVNLSLAHGYAIMVNLGQGKAIANPEPLRRYVAMRKRLEQESAPGYPNGFRDTVGLKWEDPALEARAFRGPAAGITVVYYATAPVDTELEVDGAALGFPGLGTKRRRVKLDKDGIDFWILKPPAAASP